MLFETEPDLGSQPNRPKTLAISIVIHLLLIGLIVVRPDLLKSVPKRIIRIAGQEYDLDKTKLQELTLAMPRPNPARPPAVAEDRPLVQPPAPERTSPPPPQPPPPPPPPTPPPPNVVISPEDVIAEGARPDAQPKASRGNTEERARAGSPSEPAPAPSPQPPKAESPAGPQVAQNTNPNALHSPSLLARRDQILDQNSEEARRRAMQGGRTGIGAGIDAPNFSAEEGAEILSDTRGYDFGPYMNQVVNRVRVNWYSLIPEIARLGAKGRVMIIFTINHGGGVQDLRVVANSGLDPLDRAAQGSITYSNPFQKLPAGFDGDELRLQFTFLYNMR